MEENCTACIHLQHDCGGHWRRSHRFATSNPDGRRGRVDLDIQDGYSHFRADNTDYEDPDQ